MSPSLILKLFAMKHILFVITFMLVFSEFQNVFAQYPIPSNNVSVRERANFQESQPARGKRKMNVWVQCSGSSFAGTCQATVWIYSLDGQTILGPFTVNGGETLSVQIDDRAWGVYMQTDNNIIVDVWTSTEDSMNKLGLLNHINDPLKMLGGTLPNCTDKLD